ncbi:MAG TPA: hypothetical protein PKN50_17810 [Spirochaetota bacterium]|nr:hypothetical protein [Spirochaetota bacterium]HPV43303.1 hypothetical protein [Spirochaetota bacterium]
MRQVQVKGYIQVYSRKTRDEIMKAGGKILSAAGLEGMTSDLFACVDELIKNAVKADYKYVLLRDRILKKLQQLRPDKSPDEINQNIDTLMKHADNFNRMAEEILKKEDLSAIVREILNEESRLLTIKNRAYLENRSYTEEEKKEIMGLTMIRDIQRQIKEQNIKIILRIQADDDFMYIEVTNTAPILTRDINRIHDKRDEHRRYRDEGREHEFFVDNIDTSESGFGFGYAKIDVILYNMGITSERAITIISSINTTVMLTLPMDQLKKHFIA